MNFDRSMFKLTFFVNVNSFNWKTFLRASRCYHGVFWRFNLSVWSVPVISSFYLLLYCLSTLRKCNDSVYPSSLPLSYLLNTFQDMSNVILHNVMNTQASLNTKYHCLYGYYFLGISRADLAILFKKSKSTISSWITSYEQNGLLSRKQREQVFRKSKLSTGVGLSRHTKQNRFCSWANVGTFSSGNLGSR